MPLDPGLSGHSAQLAVVKANSQEQEMMVKNSLKNVIWILVPVGHLGHLALHLVDPDIRPEAVVMERLK